MSAPSYELLDSGDGRKLERLGDVLVDRQAPAAVWRKRLPAAEWSRADGRHVRSNRGGGYWEWINQVPEEWRMSHGELEVIARPTPFGHAGLFAEQLDQWRWLKASCESLTATLGRPPHILNLFAYTGGSTLACVAGGARVTHVDAARGVVDWARRNAEINRAGPDAVRWIVDDCQGYVTREVRRGTEYDGVILDPPSFGRGKRNEVWKIENGLPPLLDDLGKLLADRAALVLFTCHTPGFTPVTLTNLLDDSIAIEGMTAESGEMSVKASTGRSLPAGHFLRLARP